MIFISLFVFMAVLSLSHATATGQPLIAGFLALFAAVSIWARSREITGFYWRHRMECEITLLGIVTLCGATMMMPGVATSAGFVLRLADPFESAMTVKIGSAMLAVMILAIMACARRYRPVPNSS